jgi:hypothetical protein
MLPDLRLLITAIVVTFLLAAAAGLYASLRVTQEQIAARADARAALEENPITRISNSWPLPEPSRAAALRDLTKLPSGMPIVAATEPEPAPAPERSELQITPSQVIVEMPQPQPPITPPVNDPQMQVALRETTPPEVTHSTGIATPPEKTESATAAPTTPAVQPADQPDVHGNAGNRTVSESAKPRTGKASVTVYKKPMKKTRAVARKRRPAPPAVPAPFDQLLTGYPLYLTVPVTN